MAPSSCRDRGNRTDGGTPRSRAEVAVCLRPLPGWLRLRLEGSKERGPRTREPRPRGPLSPQSFSLGPYWHLGRGMLRIPGLPTQGQQRPLGQQGNQNQPPTPAQKPGTHLLHGPHASQVILSVWQVQGQGGARGSVSCLTDTCPNRQGCSSKGGQGKALEKLARYEQIHQNQVRS